MHTPDYTNIQKTPRWEHFPHSSDVGIRGMGPSLEVAFEQAALAMIAVITDPRIIEQKISIDIHIVSPNIEILFLDWINELIFQIATQNIIFSNFCVCIHGTTLTATVIGEQLSQDKHAPAVEIKGATMTALAVYKNKSGLWIGQCVLDV